MTALARLGEVSRAYEIAADEYRGVVVAAAEADAAHRKARGKAVLREKAQSPGMSHAEAVTRAEADDTIADLYLARVTTAAVAESHLEKLRQLKEQQANGRSAVATDRDVDRLHAQGLSGAA
jgi:SLT domain-containing protein